ncbi:MAG: hypothetical protein EAZ92_06960 [Candidatus Kapaibacterium sp.]|nr:MAG: hypothetical protein EAZ92_06960 [Candidatus Kapabacteria bacterium]
MISMLDVLPPKTHSDAAYDVHSDNYRALVTRLHAEACMRGDTHYRDPATGYIVFTRLKHEMRGYCCKSGCRHCAYGYKKA